jgi:cellulase/cellobiase CelA1
MAGALGGLGSAAPANAAPQAASPASAVSCTVHVYGNWGSGFVLEVVTTNSGTTPAPFPPLTWTWPGTQQITAPVWGATLSQSGETVTATEPSGFVIAPGGSAAWGFTVRGTLPSVLPIPCTQV